MDALENLEVWKRSCRLSVQMYEVMGSCSDYGFKDQVTRSALSVPSNIAEGYERGGPKEIARFLRIAKGSIGELRTQLYIGIEAGFLDREQGLLFIREGAELSKMLYGLIKHYETK